MKWLNANHPSFDRYDGFELVDLELGNVLTAFNSKCLLLAVLAYGHADRQTCPNLR